VSTATQAITKNGGERMTAWCDVAAPWPLTPASADDSAGLALSGSWKMRQLSLQQWRNISIIEHFPPYTATNFRVE
jgi:hypothetical protein